MNIVDDRTNGEGGSTFAQVAVSQTCLINGERWLKIANADQNPNTLKLEGDFITGNAAAVQPVSDITNFEGHLKPL